MKSIIEHKKNALQLEGHRTSRQSFLAVSSQIYTAHAHKLLVLNFWLKFGHRH